MRLTRLEANAAIRQETVSGEQQRGALLHCISMLSETDLGEMMNVRSSDGPKAVVAYIHGCMRGEPPTAIQRQVALSRGCSLTHTPTSCCSPAACALCI